MDEALWPADGRIVVGVSGGPDSTALLLILAALAKQRPLQLTAAYFDHGLRGTAAAAAERDAVETLACRAGVEVVCATGEVRSLAKAGHLSLEEAARRARYDFLARVALERGIVTVAAGHTADDQAETVLMHLIRGSGLTGIAGIHPRSRWPSPGFHGLTLIRPLLRLSRSETEAYCKAAGIEPLQDESNGSLAFLRNRVRAELLPLLRRYNPRVRDALVRLADSAREDIGVLEPLAGEAVTLSSEGAALDRSTLGAMPPALRNHAVRQALLRLLGDLQGIGQRHIDAVTRMAIAPGSGGRLDLPRGVSAAVTRELVTLSLDGPPLVEFAHAEAVPLPVPGAAAFGPGLAAAGPAPLEGATATCEVSAAVVGPRLWVRGWRPGDRMQPAGMTGTKKLQDIFVDAHVPRSRRASVPVFETPAGIVWVAGLRLAAWARPEAGAATLILSYRAGG
jgi:tRNA(Ile)-lysidine synthase